MSTIRPVTRSSMISGTEPRRNPRTGVPHAIASIMTSSKWFGPIDWKQQRQCVAEEFCFVAIVDLSHELHAGATEQGCDYLTKIGFVDFVDFGGDL